mgnify:CR=1 FL=1
MVKAVLFDVDGTLVDSNDLHAHAWAEAFRQFGVEVPLAAIYTQIGKGGDNLIPALLPPDVVQQQQAAIEAYRSELFQRDYLPRVVPFAGVRPLFERLAGDGIRILLASSSRQAEVSHMISLLGVEDLVDDFTSKDDVEHSKPCPDIFEAALRKVAPVGADRAIAVGDSPWDVKAAAGAGLRTIGVRSGGFSDADLNDAGAVQLFDDPEDLLANYASSPLSR